MTFQFNTVKQALTQQILCNPLSLINQAVCSLANYSSFQNGNYYFSIVSDRRLKLTTSGLNQPQ